MPFSENTVKINLPKMISTHAWFEFQYRKCSLKNDSSGCIQSSHKHLVKLIGIYVLLRVY